tara:strand:+ start:3212 stop:4090 length:879 start_codon:yes stop_codon:yes gene_type:complete
MAQPIKVLLVDDKEDYCKSLSGPARYKNIQIVYELDWENGFEILKKDFKIEFVILDGKGKIEADQETEKDNFVIRAMRDIDKYSKEIDRHIPYCVNTGFMERFEALEDNVKIFEKNDSQRETMFQFIINEVTQSEYRSIRMQFNEAFMAFDMVIVSKDYEPLLVNIIKAYNEKDYRKVNLNIQRDLLEGIYISLNKEIPCIPIELFKDNGLPIQEHCTKFMENKNISGHRINKDVPQVIKSAFRKLKESTNGYSHLSNTDVVKIPFLANVFLIMEILEWLPEFAQTHYENYI